MLSETVINRSEDNVQRSDNNVELDITHDEVHRFIPINNSESISDQQALMQIVKMSVPFTFNNYATTFDKYFKVLMISKLGSSNLAAVSIAFTIKNVVTGLEGSLLRPVQPMVAQNFSSRNYEIAGSILQNAWLIGAIESIPVAVLLSFSKPIISLLWGNKELAALSSTYLIPFGLGVVLERWRDADIAFLSSIGKEQSTILFILIPKGFGLLMAYGLILGKLGMPKLGLAGAAYSGIVETLLSNLMLKLYFRTGKCFREFKIFNIRLRSTLAQAKTILKLGAPSAVFSIIQFPIDIIQNIMLGKLGESSLILDQIVWQNLSYTSPIVNALVQATSITTAQSAGEKQFAKMRQYALVGLFPNLVLSIFTTIGLGIFSKQLFDLFYDDNNKFELSDETIRIIFILAGISGCLMGSAANTVGNLRAIYDVYIPTAIEIATAFLVVIPLCYLFSQPLDGGIIGLYIAQLIGRIVLNVAWGMRWHDRANHIEINEPILSDRQNLIAHQGGNDVQSIPSQDSGEVPRSNSTTYGIYSYMRTRLPFFNLFQNNAPTPNSVEDDVRSERQAERRFD
jgi:MATE family multidrug resistance protein